MLYDDLTHAVTKITGNVTAASVVNKYGKKLEQGTLKITPCSRDFV